jgi:hypothetical protein
VFFEQNVAVYLVKNLSPQMVAIENGKNMPFLKKFFLSLYIPYFFNEKQPLSTIYP